VSLWLTEKKICKSEKWRVGFAKFTAKEPLDFHLVNPDHIDNITYSSVYAGKLAAQLWQIF
jgi:hypothetical protein